MENAELKVEYLPVGDLKQYSGNAKRHPKKQVAEIRESIEQFGFNDPIAVWKNGEIIEGHGRLLAALEMGMDKVPVIRLDSLTDEERRAYVLAHNQTTLSSGWDEKKLRTEIQNLPTIDMGKFGFNVEALEGLDEGWYGDERERTNDAYNLGIAWETEFTEDFWQMPVIRKTDHYPETLIGFNYAKTSEEKYAGVHFFVDDYQFERVWNDPEKYVDILLQYDCILSPDFSLYLDMHYAKGAMAQFSPTRKEGEMVGARNAPQRYANARFERALVYNARSKRSYYDNILVVDVYVDQ